MPSHAEKDLNNSIAAALGVVVKNTAPDPGDPKVLLRAGTKWPSGDPAAWRGKDMYQASARIGGSENWPMMALAAKMLLGSPAEKAEADISAVAWLTEQKTVRGWMGSEVGSRVYAWMHLESVLVFYRDGSAALRALAGEWLDLYFSWLRQAWDAKLLRVLWLGQRSCLPGRDQVSLEDDLAAWINDAAPFPTHGGTYDRLIIYALRPVLEQIKARPSANPAWKTATPVDFYRGDDGVAVRVEAEVNSNTPPTLGASTVGGVLAWAPALPWQDFHMRATGGRCVEGEGVLAYTAAAVYKPTKVALPTNARRVRLGSGALSGASAPPSLPTAPIGVLPSRPFPGSPAATAPVKAPKKGFLAKLGCLLPILAGVLALLAGLVVLVYAGVS